MDQAVLHTFMGSAKCRPFAFSALFAPTVLTKYESSRMVLRAEMPVLHAFPTGVQRAVARGRGLGCPQKPFFSLLLAAAGGERSKRSIWGHLGPGDPRAPAGRTLHPRLCELFQKFGMT